MKRSSQRTYGKNSKIWFKNVLGSFHRECSAVLSETPFDIHSLNSEALLKLFDEVSLLIPGIRVEMVPGGSRHGTEEEHPASTVGLSLGMPAIRFVDSLNDKGRIEAVAHECVHLVLIYRYGLGVIARKTPRYGNSDDVFRYFMSMGGDWIFLLGQVANTVHHLILADYLKKEYGIESLLHTHFLDHNFRLIAKENNKDEESLYAKGIIAFEYDRLIGKVERVIHTFRQTESFWKAYRSAQKHFMGYSFHSIPDPSGYEENILSFLEDLGYPRQDFIFFPKEMKDVRNKDESLTFFSPGSYHHPRQ